MPALIEFYENNKDLKDSFEFISVHNKHALATDFDVLDKSLADRKIVEERWNGKNMTWPLMIDGNAVTAREWGIFGYPTMAIIDPEGKLHSFGHHHLKAFAEIMADVRAKKAGGAKAAEGDKPAEPSKAGGTDAPAAPAKTEKVDPPAEPAKAEK